MSLHVKSFRILMGDTTLHVDLQIFRDPDKDVFVRARMSRQSLKGKEKFLGFANLNRAGELVNSTTEDLTEDERSAIETEIAEALM